jgi:hypothetical protein
VLRYDPDTASACHIFATILARVGLRSARARPSVPPPALPGFRGTANLSATPGRPICPSRASGWSSLTTPWGFPCCVRFPCVHAVATTPAQRLGVLLRSLHPAVSAFPDMAVGSACALSFSRFARRSLRYGLHTRAVTVYRDPLTEGFSHFVTSIAAPVASGWSARRVGFAPTGKRRLSTAHASSGLMRCNKRACSPAGTTRHLGTVPWHPSWPTKSPRRRSSCCLVAASGLGRVEPGHNDPRLST